MSAVGESAGVTPPDWFGDPDPDLQAIVSVLNQNPLAAFGLTLTVGGTVVTGTAVGAAAYWTIMAEQDPEDRSGLRGFLLDSARMALEAAEPPSDPSSVTFVHLVDSAHWVSGEGCIPTDQRALWRGRLSEVQGWSLGWLGEQPEPSTVLQHRAALEALDAGIDREPTSG